MPDPIPAAAPAATPAAAPAAPAPAATPPAAAAPPAAAPPASAAPPAASTDDSLLPADPGAPVAPPAAEQTPEQKLAAAKELIRQHEEAANPNNGKSWLLTDGVMGQGEKPAWFKADKYKNVAEQAKAYTDLEKRFGSFTGAPKNEKGEVAYKPFAAPEGIEVTADHPVMVEFDKWAGANQLSQEGRDTLLGMLVQYEAQQAPDVNAIMTQIGENAPARLASIAAWGKANLGEAYADLREALKPSQYTPAVVKALESVIAKTSQVRMPKPGEDVPGGQPGQNADTIRAKLAEKLPDGRRKADVVPGYRQQINKELADYFAQFPAGTQYQPDGWKTA